MKNRWWMGAVVAALVAGPMACGKAESAPGGAAGATAKAQVPVIAAYDVVREALASDDLAAAKAATEKLVAAAGDAAGVVAAAKDALGKTGDIEVFRTAFGDVSKALITAIQAQPALGEGLIAYRCPMAQGYKKWVQTGPPMRNPYMGAKMLECGSKTDFVP